MTLQRIARQHSTKAPLRTTVMAVMAIMAATLAAPLAGAAETPATPGKAPAPPARTTRTTAPAPPPPATPPTSRAPAPWLVPMPTTGEPAPLPRPVKVTPRPAHGKVWTLADLERLRSAPGSSVNVLETAPSDSALDLPYAPEDPNNTVQARMRELLVEAAQAKQLLQRERVTSLNPYIRNGGVNDKGEAIPKRSVGDIDAELAWWLQREQEALEGLDLVPRTD